MAVPSVSVVILSHRQDLLPEAFASVRAQTYPDVEIVVKFADAWWPDKLNAAIRGTSAEYFCVLCDDDKLAPTWVERTLGAIAAEQADFAYTDNFVFGPLRLRYALPDFSLTAVQRDCVPHVTALTRRTLWEQLGGYDGAQPYFDWDFWLRAAKAGARGAHVRDYLMHYRVWHANGSRSMSHPHALDALAAKHPDLVRPAPAAA